MPEIADHLRPQRPEDAGEAGDVIEVVLEGGPVSFPAELRAHRVSPTQQKMKIRHYGGYEHFERVAAGHDEAPVVFRWTGRTRIAE